MPKNQEDLQAKLKALEATSIKQAEQLAEREATIDGLRHELNLRRHDIYQLRWWMEQVKRDVIALFRSQTWKIGRLAIRTTCRLLWRKPDSTVENHLLAIMEEYTGGFHQASEPASSHDEVYTADRAAGLREETLQAARKQVADLPQKPIAVMAVTTFNRKAYLDECVRTWHHTKSDHFRWRLIVADDGSSDGTQDYMAQMALPDVEVHLIYNQHDGIPHQNNAIFKALNGSGFDICFMADDDMVFHEEGWDLSYYYQILRTGFDHLVYFSTDWHAPIHAEIKNSLVSFASCEYAQGGFYTITQHVLDTVGYNDCLNFGKHGLEHVDYTARCCRAGFNLYTHLLDIPHNEYYMALQIRDMYMPALSERDKKAENPEHILAKKRTVIATDNRVYIPFNDSATDRAPQRLSIIIPHYAGDKTRNRNLEYILTYYHQINPEAQIIVAEQKTNSVVPGFVDHIYIENEHPFSRSLGFNEGVRHADGDVFLLVDNDCIVNEDLLREFVSGTQYAYLDMVIPFAYLYDLSEEETKAGIVKDVIGGGEKRDRQSFGGATLITKTAYRKVGGFDPQFFGWGMEDNAFYEKCRVLLTVYRAEDFRLYHLNHTREGSVETLKKTEEYRANCLEYIKIKHFTKEELLTYIDHLGVDHFT